MLTVDYDKLGLRAGDLLLDLGCGYGRHAYEALRRGARVVACDMSTPELHEVLTLFRAMALEGEAPPNSMAGCVTGDATRLPYPDNTFDHIIASEVMEHIPDDIGAMNELYRVLKPGGKLAITIPAWFPEKVCWAITDEYYAPKSEGGHVRIYTEAEMRRKMRGAGLRPREAHNAHALHSAYWWLKCAVGIPNNDHPLVKPYNKLLVWDIEKKPFITRTAERILNPVLGKSLVVYATKPIRNTTEPDGASRASRPTRPKETAHAGA
jgi:SAM-dependent methyltransferase